ncbi:TetR family transcriptional regulator [Sphingomonas spermidinifaciens]|uniref:TetR family transcriptional regulator n=1 Tax=Sphingomonas spermidinifaciens TaxID=1141889 RepID=A0A2A4B2G4_9SPHN|nr:TetR/AcrR family transcriptional regulator [Sphingomonas spermidinifaciens]PCD02132.1 TetR family transcriptional regulator [Sphingomonas spermidinifaciens]
MASKAEKSYHREDLRGDLVRAGRDYVEAHGYHSLSVRTLAQSVGVSAGAPYRHFADRRALLLAIAIDGYTDLFSTARAINASAHDPEEALIGAGLGYLDFVTTHPRLAELMYESELTSPSIDPALLDYQHIGQAALTEPLRAALPDCDEAELAIRVLALWSSIYGFATLRKRQMVSEFVPDTLASDDVARRVITVAVHAAING